MEGSTKASVSRLLVQLQLAWRALCSVEAEVAEEVIDGHVSRSGGQAHIAAVAVAGAGARASMQSERAVRHTRSTKVMDNSGDQHRWAADSGVIYKFRS